MDRDRLSRIRNFQSQDFYPALFIRPLCIGIMLIVADWRFLTPNRLTTLGIVCKVVCSWLIFRADSFAGTVWAVVFLNLGLIFDHLDGTMARYRRTFTAVGSYFDKVADFLNFFLISAALGWRAYQSTGEPYYLVLACASAYEVGALTYLTWLVTAESERLRWLEARSDPPSAVARYTAPIVISPPPVRTRTDWMRWFATMTLRFWKFEGADLYLWMSIGLLLARPDWAVWLMFASQAARLTAMLVKRSREIARVDRRTRELELG
jgi:phosphatidylglycerophosphate synthase